MKSNSPQINIAIDLMGGDNGIKVTIPAVISCAKKNSEVLFLCVGKPSEIKNSFQNISNIKIIPAEEEVSMDDSPRFAIKNKKDSSMRVAIDLVRDTKASACVSSGNTGALMATAHFRLKMLPGISRPAIMSCLPTHNKNKSVMVLDLGANSDVKPKALHEFALIATATAKAKGISDPTIGLLNIGHEHHKGPDKIKDTNKLLEQTKGINYQGYTEGDKIFSGDLDIIICDGFVGNVLLKSCEGLMAAISASIKKSCKKSIIRLVLTVLAKKSLQQVINHFHPDSNNGAILSGLNGIVVKSHGGANIKAFEAALTRAIDLIKGPSVKQELQSLLLLNQDK